MKPSFIFLLSLSLWLQKVPCDEDDLRNVFIGSDLEDRWVLLPNIAQSTRTFRARIIMVNGSVFLYAGANKNISFVTTRGGEIYLGSVNVNSLPNKAATTF